MGQRIQNTMFWSREAKSSEMGQICVKSSPVENTKAHIMQPGITQKTCMNFFSLEK